MSAAVPAPQATPVVEPGYWTLVQLAAFLDCSRWTIARRVKADPAFPVLHGFGGPRFPIERVKAHLQRQEQGRGRAYKSRRFLHSVAQVPAAPSAQAEAPGA